MNIRCIYCGFEVGTGLRCCGVAYNLNGTYQIPPEKRRPPPPMAFGPVSGGDYEDRARNVAPRTAPNPAGQPTRAAAPPHQADPVAGSAEPALLDAGDRSEKP